MSMYIFGSGDDAEKIMRQDYQNQLKAAERITDAQRLMLDGKLHYFLYLDGYNIGDPNVCVGVVRPRDEVYADIESTYADEEYGDPDQQAQLIESGKAHDDEMRRMGFPKLQWWDGVYEVDGRGDWHDLHVTRLLEITEEQFRSFRAIKQNARKAMEDPELRELLIDWVMKVYNANPWAF